MNRFLHDLIYNALENFFVLEDLSSQAESEEQNSNDVRVVDPRPLVYDPPVELPEIGREERKRHRADAIAATVAAVASGQEKHARIEKVCYFWLIIKFSITLNYELIQGATEFTFYTRSKRHLGVIALFFNLLLAAIYPTGQK